MAVFKGTEKDRGPWRSDECDEHGLLPKQIYLQENSPRNEFSGVMMRFMKSTKHNNTHFESKRVEKY